MGERSCAPLGFNEMPASLAELWNRALMSRAAASPSNASATLSDIPQDVTIDSAELHAEVAALLTEEGEGAVLSELLGEMSPGFATDPLEDGVGLMQPGAAGRHLTTKKKRRRGSPREHPHRVNSDVSCTSTTSEASDASSSSVMTMLYPSLF
eukprot:CAMPEP_0119081706 /NCGR_PEP_ID=MMETSP1178-20130426/118093_1 /TAXON_ID=33656 /ORGANISM="unid sp, Strain CCMP2000" /LENGTH=152 /DNA_ID=CAMNT_0007064431 /DNA_START=190 /DNA_END=648 /DNA_ORIENTATION=-